MTMMMVIVWMMMRRRMIRGHKGKINTLRCMLTNNLYLNLGISLASLVVWRDSSTLLLVILA